MARLTYGMLASVDGYVVDAEGGFGWAEPDEEVHAFVNERERSIGTYLYGRRMYETMQGWETDPALAADSPLLADYAATWQAADKIIYSTTLDAPVTRRTTVVRTFDADAVRRLKDTAEGDLCVAGPGLAAAALRAGLVDELQVYQVPTVVGGGLTMLPAGVHLDLELTEWHRFGGGTVYLRYAVRA